MSNVVLNFEREEDPQGAWIPLAVRMKLDLLGVKVGLDDWQVLPDEVREELIETDVEQDRGLARFHQRLREALAAAGCDGPRPLPEKKLAGRDAWQEAGPVPAEVARLGARLGLEVPWLELDRFGRYVLWHLGSKGADTRFTQALQELTGVPGLRPGGA